MLASLLVPALIALWIGTHPSAVPHWLVSQAGLLSVAPAAVCLGGYYLWRRANDARVAAQHGQVPESLGGLEHASDHGPA